MNVYTTKELEKLGEGARIIGLCKDWTGCHGLELRRLDLQGAAPETIDWQCIYLDGKHVGDKTNIDKSKDKKWTDYSEAFKVDENNRLNDWRGKEIRLKDDTIYGEIHEGILQNVSEFCVVLKVLGKGSYFSRSAWPKDENGRHYYTRILDSRALKQEDWELVSEA